MIRIRKTDGTVFTVPPDAQFVELVNDVDQTVMLAFLQVKPGTILMIKPGTKDALRYEEMFATQGIKFSNSMVVRGSE